MALSTPPMRSAEARCVRLIGDIGGTNARLALARGGAWGELATYLSDDYPTIQACIEDYLADHAGEDRPTEIALAIAGPVAGDRVAMTNHPWSFTKTELKEKFGVKRLEILNDFTANAVALPYLKPEDLEPVGGGTKVGDAPIGVLGPGTGLGVSGLVPAPDKTWIPLTGEGGHITLAASTDRESDVIANLRRRFDHVSAERLLSGDGLVNIYHALCALDGVPTADYKPAQITDAGQRDSQCLEAVDLFCAMLGAVAGDLALTLGAAGGIYIAGGIVPRLGPRFARSRFRRRFEDKGRFRAYLEKIPTLLITNQHPALVGLACMK